MRFPKTFANTFYCLTAGAGWGEAVAIDKRGLCNRFPWANVQSGYMLTNMLEELFVGPLASTHCF